MRSLRPKSRKKDRVWGNRPKVSSCLSKNFPWEVVIGWLKMHPRSMIILQMVDRNLRHTIQTNDLMWTEWFNRSVRSKSFLNRGVSDPLFPQLKLYKYELTGIPVHIGLNRGNASQSDTFDPDFNTYFTKYVIRAFALMHGTRCGVCGCRHRHEAYWSLRMRVCKLCMAENTITGWTLFNSYGVDYTDIISLIARKVFYYSANLNMGMEKVAFYDFRASDIRNKSLQYMFWLPHLSKLLDLPALRVDQVNKKSAATLLTSVVRRHWIACQRVLFADKKARHSIDCLTVTLFRNERKRVAVPYKKFMLSGGPEWGFPEPSFSKECKYTARNGEPVQRLFRRLAEFEDCVI